VSPLPFRNSSSAYCGYRFLYQLVICMDANSVYHGYGFSRGFQLLVYTGTGTVYEMSEPCNTVPVWKVLRCLAVYVASDGPHLGRCHFGYLG
jgi:hypothetical protein